MNSLRDVAESVLETDLQIEIKDSKGALGGQGELEFPILTMVEGGPGSFDTSGGRFPEHRKENVHQLLTTGSHHYYQHLHRHNSNSKCSAGVVTRHGKTCGQIEGTQTWEEGPVSDGATAAAVGSTTTSTTHTRARSNHQQQQQQQQCTAYLCGSSVFSSSRYGPIVSAAESTSLLCDCYDPATAAATNTTAIGDEDDGGGGGTSLAILLDTLTCTTAATYTYTYDNSSSSSLSPPASRVHHALADTDGAEDDGCNGGIGIGNGGIGCDCDCGAERKAVGDKNKA